MKRECELQFVQSIHSICKANLQLEESPAWPAAHLFACWLSAKLLLKPRSTQQLGRKRPLLSSLPTLCFILMAMTSPLGTELSHRGVPATLTLVPLLLSLLPSKRRMKPKAWGSPSVSKTGNPNEGKLCCKDSC